MSITCSFLYQIKNFFHLWIFWKENYKKKLNMKNNTTMYKELKLKKGNWIFMSLIHASITPFHFQWTYLSHFFIKLRIFYNIGCAKRRIANVKGNGIMYKEFKFKNKNWIVMFNYWKSPSPHSKGITCSNFHRF
jgi:hypothetical protein